MTTLSSGTAASDLAEGESKRRSGIKQRVFCGSALLAFLILPTLAVAQIQVFPEPGFNIFWSPPEGEFFNGAVPVAGNRALASAGAIPFGSSELGAPTHTIANINDGLFGNSHSWIAAGSDPEPLPFVGVEFAVPVFVEALAWGRDNNDNTSGTVDPCNECTDRWEGDYFIEVTTDPNAAADPGAVTWTRIGRVEYASPATGMMLWRRHVYETSVGGGGGGVAASRSRPGRCGWWLARTACASMSSKCTGNSTAMATV